MNVSPGLVFGDDGSSCTVPGLQCRISCFGKTVPSCYMWCEEALCAMHLRFWFLNSENFEATAIQGLLSAATSSIIRSQLAVDGMIHVSSGALQPVFYALIALLGRSCNSLFCSDTLLGTRTLLATKGIATRNKKLLGAPGHTTRSKDATSSHTIYCEFASSEAGCSGWHCNPAFVCFVGRSLRVFHLQMGSCGTE